MNKLTKIGVSALAGSLALTAANAIEMSVSGSAGGAMYNYDEGNNKNHLVVTGASIGSPGLVPSFAPSLGLLLLVGIAIGLLQRRTRV